jgi:hypothetical protein
VPFQIFNPELCNSDGRMQINEVFKIQGRRIRMVDNWTGHHYFGLHLIETLSQERKPSYESLPTYC